MRNFTIKPSLNSLRAHAERATMIFDDFRYPEVIPKWRDIPPGIYKILEYFDRGRNTYGRSIVLKLEHENRSIVFVWAPTSVVFALEQNKEAKYIWNIGVKVSENGNRYFDFKIC